MICLYCPDRANNVKRSNPLALARARTLDPVTFEIGYGTRIVLAGDQARSGSQGEGMQVTRINLTADAWRGMSALSQDGTPAVFSVRFGGSSGMLAIVDLRKDTRL
jgi:hypothetical protein